MLQRLDDRLRWIEAREALAAGARVLGFDADRPGSGVILHPALGFAVVIGHPDRNAVAEAASAVPELIAFPGNHVLVGSVVPRWMGELVTLFDLPDMARLADPDAGNVRIVEPDELADIEVESEALRRELFEAAEEGATLFASLDGDRPVSFCYDASCSERLWDIGVDTMEGFRGRGHAWRSASAAIRYWEERGRTPRWACGETNVASRRLARKLGFRPADAMVIFEAEID